MNEQIKDENISIFYLWGIVSKLKAMWIGYYLVLTILAIYVIMFIAVRKKIFQKRLSMLPNSLKGFLDAYLPQVWHLMNCSKWLV